MPKLTVFVSTLLFSPFFLLSPFPPPLSFFLLLTPSHTNTHTQTDTSQSYPALHKTDELWMAPPEVGVPKLHWFIGLGLGQ